ncbi:MAG: hypothetical protein JO332_16695 [Planctomycetaceae bacterium]|nr:hypothetical protein [Planctomycetaceae bacterium]
METLLRVDKENPVFAPYLKLLVKSDTLKAAEMAKSILESAYRLHQIEPEYGDACELIARRLPQPPLELFAYCAQSEASGMGAVRALAAVGTEPAVALLIRMRLGSYSSRTLIARSLRSAKRYPALQQQLRDLLAGSRIQGNYGNFPSFPALAYLEGDSGSLESLLKAWTHPDFDAARKLAVLQTALTIPDSDGKIQAALPTVARDSDGSESMLAEVYRVIVAGGAPKPVPSLQRSGYPLLMAAWARDRAAVAKLLESGSPTTYSQVRDLVEAAFNRPLPRFEDARHWAKNAGATPTPDSMIVELQALGVTDLRRALRDDRQFVRVNAAWILQKQAGRRQYSRGPWADTTKDSSDGFRWTFPEPPAAEIEALEKP